MKTATPIQTKTSSRKLSKTTLTKITINSLSSRTGKASGPHTREICPPQPVLAITFPSGMVLPEVRNILLYLLHGYSANGNQLDVTMNSFDDLLKETERKLTSSKMYCSSVESAVAYASTIAKNLLCDSNRKFRRLTRLVTSIPTRINDDDEANEESRSWEFFSAAEVAHLNMQDYEMRDLLEVASSRLTDLDPIDRAILDGIADPTFRHSASPSDKETAASCNAKQNTVTVRRGKLKAKLQSAMKDIGYIPRTSSRTQAAQPFPAKSGPITR